MTTLEALFLGLIQGLTEFLPISSSGHLLLAQTLLGYENPRQYLLFDLVCHLGTLLAIFVYYFQRLVALAYGDDKTLLKLFLGTVPLGAVIAVLPYLDYVYVYPSLLGVFFLITAALLFSSHCQRDKMVAPRWYDPLVIGSFQAIAVLPGISRSGATIAAARLMGWPRQEAVAFSFMLAIPAILGGLSLELLRIFLSNGMGVTSVETVHYAVGLTVSFITGWGAIALATRLVLQNKMVYFAWYCLALGIFCLCYFARM